VARTTPESRWSRGAVTELARELADDTGLSIHDALVWVERVWRVASERARRDTVVVLDR
jgi:hypothetical protein